MLSKSLFRKNFDFSSKVFFSYYHTWWRVRCTLTECRVLRWRHSEFLAEENRGNGKSRRHSPLPLSRNADCENPRTPVTGKERRNAERNAATYGHQLSHFHRAQLLLSKMTKNWAKLRKQALCWEPRRVAVNWSSCCLEHRGRVFFNGSIEEIAISLIFD